MISIILIIPTILFKSRSLNATSVLSVHQLLTHSICINRKRRQLFVHVAIPCLHT